MNVEIELCPICGGTVSVVDVRWETMGGDQPPRRARCASCGHTGPKEMTTYNAVSAWNAMCEKIRELAVSKYLSTRPHLAVTIRENTLVADLTPLGVAPGDLVVVVPVKS